MLHSLVRNWWVILLRGFIALVYGIIAFIWPGITLITLLYFLGFYLLADGVLGLFTVISSWGHREDKWILVLDGLLSLGVGAIALRSPVEAGIAIIFIVGFWAILGGITKIAFAIHVRNEIKGEGWIAFSGVLSILLGFFLMANPLEGSISLIWLIASFSIVIGFMWIITAFRIRSFSKRMRY